VEKTAVAGKDEERQGDEEGRAPAGSAESNLPPCQDRRREEESHPDLGEETPAYLE
jgi:hypothetical protein